VLRELILVLLVIGAGALTVGAKEDSTRYATSEYLMGPGTNRSTIPPVPDRLDLTPSEVADLYGPPLTSFRNLMVYESGYADVEADVTFFFLDGTLAQISLAFPAEGVSRADVRRHADRVLKRLWVDYGPPSSVSRVAGIHKTHRWLNGSGELRHVVVYSEGSARHLLRVERTRSAP
jgi:hypothetical protein